MNATVARSPLVGVRSNDAPSADVLYMRRAIELAWKGAGWTNPNPLVGAVIVKDGRVIGEGFHEKWGEAHAERNALADCAARGEDPAGSTLYVTLEPCCHQGKQPPCTEAVIAAGVRRVIVGSRDPNPLVAGRGNEQLRGAGIEVAEDVLRGECDELNPIFFHYIQTGLPFIMLKWAMTLDGKIATRTDDSRWISNEASRADVHESRHRMAAIMVGSGTVSADDPMLTARRDIPSNQPLRVVVDSSLSISSDCQLVRSARDFALLVATTQPEDSEKARLLRERGVDIISVSPVRASGKVNLKALITLLGERGVDSILVEGGGTLNEALLAADLVNEIIVYLAPKVIGGADAKSPVEGFGVERMVDAFTFEAPEIERFGDDLKLTYRRVRPEASVSRLMKAGEH